MVPNAFSVYQSVHKRYLHRRDVLKNLTEAEEDDYLDELDVLWGQLTPGEREQVNKELRNENGREVHQKRT